MASKIGIKLADGTFFPIMDEDSSALETLELTTVRDDQESVQINLFKKEEDSDLEYVGSLVVEDIQQKNAGDATIALKLSLDEDKNLSAEAVDIDSGSREALNVSLKTFDEDTFDTIDFDLNENTDDADGDDFSTSVFYSDEEKEEERKRGFPVWLIILLLLLGIAALGLAVLLLNKKTPSVSESETNGTAVVEDEMQKTEQEADASDEMSLSDAGMETEMPPEIPSEEPPVPLAREESVDTSSEVSSTSTEEKNTGKGMLPDAVRYKIRWGDTLWDLSETYYRNPWLYKKIADHNKLTNPDLIISGTRIEIPPQ